MQHYAHVYCEQIDHHIYTFFCRALPSILSNDESFTAYKCCSSLIVTMSEEQHFNMRKCEHLPEVVNCMTSFPFFYFYL